MSNNPNLPYARYSVNSDLRCGDCSSGPQTPPSQMIPGVAYKNGKPYDCKCNLISAPYSMPYDAYNCKQCQPPYQAICNKNMAKCTCHQRASMYNNNMYEALGMKGTFE